MIRIARDIRECRGPTQQLCILPLSADALEEKPACRHSTALPLLSHEVVYCTSCIGVDPPKSSQLVFQVNFFPGRQNSFRFEMGRR